MSIALTKISILLLYERIVIQGRAKILNRVVLGVVVVCNIWAIILWLVNCIPIRAFWDNSIPAHRLPIPVNLLNAVLHIATDLMIFVLPFPSLIGLRTNLRQKIMLFIIFGVGFL